MPLLKIKLLNDDAKVPTKRFATDAGFDLYASQNADIKPHSHAIIQTGIAVEIEPCWYGRIAPRSKLANKYMINVLAGVVDSSYRGEVMISLINHSDRVFEVRKGDRVAQLIIESCALAYLMVVSELAETQRGASGINDHELRLK